MMNFAKISRARRSGTIARAMAEIMQELVSLKGDASEDDLKREGFTEAEISAYGEKARNTAAALSTKHIKRAA